jgi:hypothetical protein
MSLINDALKRAKESQPQGPAPAAPGPQLRPAEPERHARHNAALLLPVVLGVLALLVLFLVWQMAQQRGSLQVAASQAAPAPAASAQTPPAEPVPVPETAPGSPDAPAAAPSAAAETNEPSAAVVTSANSPAAAEPSEAGTNAALAPEPPKPAPLKLQGIVFSATRPSAVVSGRTLFVGSRIQNLRVAAITSDSVTLLGPGQTNVLTLER